MSNFISRFVKNHVKSTAHKTSLRLQKAGVAQDEFSSDHILNIYQSMRKYHKQYGQEIEKVLATNTNSNIDTQNPAWGLIVETREHHALEFVINNFIENVQIPVQLFHSTENLQFIQSTSISDLVKSRKVYLTELQLTELNAHHYNSLFLTKTFWENVLCRNKIVIFQTDAIICKDSDYTLQDFLSYDYIGSKWHRRRMNKLIIDGGNGGLSVRDWKKTYECLERFNPEYWQGGEDDFFAFHIELIGGKVGKKNECARFGTQHEFVFKSWGGHNISNLSPDNQNAFLEYCEDAKILLVN